MSKNLLIVAVAAGLLVTAALPSRADDDDFNAVPLIPVLAEIRISLDQGLKASYPHGWPVSAKYEIEKGVLQLFVYTARGDQFSQVIVDHRSGALTKVDPIRDRGDLADARNHNLAMAAAKLPLAAVVADAEKANGGYRAVRVVPMLAAGVAPVAVITLIKGEDVKEVSVKLD